MWGSGNTQARHQQNQFVTMYRANSFALSSLVTTCGLWMLRARLHGANTPPKFHSISGLDKFSSLQVPVEHPATYVSRHAKGSCEGITACRQFLCHDALPSLSRNQPFTHVTVKLLNLLRRHAAGLLAAMDWLSEQLVAASCPTLKCFCSSTLFLGKNS